jgi:hypothetical protein
MDYFISEVSDIEIKKERAKAREMRHSPWWKRRLAGGSCYYCGKALPVQELTMDHIVPLVRGGKSTKGNCVRGISPRHEKRGRAGLENDALRES